MVQGLHTKFKIFFPTLRRLVEVENPQVHPTLPGGMRKAIRRPPGAACGTLPQVLALANSCLHLEASCLQVLASFSVCYCLYGFALFWQSSSTLHILPISLRIPPSFSHPSLF